jgi:uncharacterized protein
MSVESGAASGPPPRRRSGYRPRTFPDMLYGEVHLSGWIAPLLDTPPFRRLAGVSLSDVPGEILFQHPFPSRLEHARGVYALARAARPRDRALHVAALAHDLGHGPLSHLTEPLMRERLGVDHEQRSALLLRHVRDALSPTARRQIAWLDWDEVAALMLGQTSDGRGALLNGRMDYDNLDYVARFLLAGDLGTPSYNSRDLARALRPWPANAPEGEADSPDGAVVVLLAEGVAGARAWLSDRATLYAWLHEGHRDLAAHAMLRKAVDLAAQAEVISDGFFDLTDSAALAYLSRRGRSGQTRLVEHVLQDTLYPCIWEAEIPRDRPAVVDLFALWRNRLALEDTLAAEAGLAPHEVVADVLVSSAYRELPPLLTAEGADTLVEDSPREEPPWIFHLFVSPTAGRDYRRRLHMAAERHLGALGAISRPSSSRR